MTFRMQRWSRVWALTGVAAGLLGGAHMMRAQAQVATPAAGSAAAIPAQVEFNRDIRPILSDKCVKCHGPATQKGGLRFDDEKSAKAELTSGGHAIVAGDPLNSDMIALVSLDDPEIRMPQDADPLTPQEIALLSKWVSQGAKWQGHWSFEKPRRAALPAVTQKGWVRNPIDSFVLARLEHEGLSPSKEADRATWLRRVTLDLIGLPPTAAELDAFNADKSPTAYEKVVDRLLASPRYGERMAYPWLEASRYADSNGYQSDGERHMWRWRDWVIDAFNRNMPFDQFAVEQLAGDMLPRATPAQVIATGFNRNHRGNSEGGIIPEEYAAEYVIDRVDATATVFLGLTAGCARCHNHKYDPLTQQQFYELYSYFNNIPEYGKARRQGNSPPYMKAPTSEQQPQLAQMDAELVAARAAYTRLNAQLVAAQAAWEPTAAKSEPVAWGPAHGLVAYYPLDGNLAVPVAVLQPRAAPRAGAAPARAAGAGGAPGAGGPAFGGAPGAAGPQQGPMGGPVPATGPLTAQNGAAQFTTGKVGGAASFDGQRFIQGEDIVGFSSYGFYDDKYSVTAWIEPTSGTGAIVTRNADVFEPTGHGLNLFEGHVQYNYVSKWLDEGIRLQSKKTVSLDQWHHIALTYDGSRYAEGVKLYVDGEAWEWEVQLDDLNNPRPLGRQPVRIGGGGGPQNRFKGDIDEVRIYNRDLSAAEVGVLADPIPIAEIAAKPASARTPAQAAKLRDYFLEHAAPASVMTAWKTLRTAQDTRDKYYESLPTVMVMQELPKPRQSFILNRGEYDKPGTPVQSKLPAFLVQASLQAKYTPNRLGLAKWLVSAENPLMARVTVNRFWQQYFGTGLVRTSEDFGSQGELPSHPELLDWLAVDFRESGWDVKRLQRLIVLSATYRQNSIPSAELLERDPANRLMARGPNVRLSAAMIRDQALAIAGLLVEKTGGPSVYPYQPPGLWRDLNSYEDYTQGHGDDLYRRSLYTFWKRTIPPPTMVNFDASSRESCVVRTGLTNTPLQALDLMNNTQYVEASRRLAQLMMQQGGATPDARIGYAFRRATARLPRPAEAAVLLRAYNEQLASFKLKPADALKYVSQGESPRDEQLDVPELAAYASVASLIFNLSQTITKD
jgi:cytochrome c553